MHPLIVSAKCIVAAVATLLALASLGTAHAGFIVLHAFGGGTDDGGMRARQVCRKLVLVGVAALATLASLGTAHARETVLYAFTGRHGDGAYPWANVIEDSAGNLYGTTWGGGGAGCRGLDGGCGIVFEISNGK